MPLAIGQVLHNRYRIVALLGQGGMGAVYRAWDLNLKIPIAIKENLETSAEAQQQFSQEAHLLARLAHPNLPRVSDYFTLPGQGEYLVMDYIEGEDLESKLAGAVSLSESEVLPWILQVCDALSYLHSQQPAIIHRDIKPANIKITPTGRAVLVDFGIAKRFDPLLSTLAGARAVTPGYSPPEQYGGAATDARSDIYALGATLYHLLTGQLPAESVQRVAGSVPGLTPRAVNPAINPLIEQTILKAMAIPMERRFQDAAEMKSALQGSDGASLGTNVSSMQGHAPTPARPRPSPTPVEPLLHRPTTAPPPPKSFMQQYLPQLVLGGGIAMLVLLAVIRVGLNWLDARAVQAQATVSAAQATAINPTLPQPTPTSPIDSLIAKAAATQTAAHPSGSPLPTTPAPTPSIPQYTRRFFDNFKDHKNKWFTGIQDSLACWIVGGRYTCQAQAGQAANHFQWLDRLSLPPEFVLSADVWPGPERGRGQGDANAGLVFRSTQQGRYLFSIRNDGYFRVSTIQADPANWLDLIPWTHSGLIRRGQDNRLVVVGRGIHYNLFINGQFIDSFDDNLWREGYPGLHLFTAPGDQPAIVEFDNFELSTP